MNETTLFLTEHQIPFLTDEPMKNHTSFRTGGPAALFASPATVDQLSALLGFCSARGVRPLILGNGSNLLVSDRGIDGLVISMCELDEVRQLDDVTFFAAAGTRLIRLCKAALAADCTGLEFAYGIPGTVGGAVFMNAGAYGGEMKQVVSFAEHLTPDGTPGRLTGGELDFGYRHSAYMNNGCIVTGAVVRLETGDHALIEEKMNDLLGRRKDKQPLEYPSAGSVFKRPEGYFAGALIEQSGLKGRRVGGAAVSEKHAGFIINVGDATTADVLNLIDVCRETVFKNFGVTLETEVRFVGER